MDPTGERLAAVDDVVVVAIDGDADLAAAVALLDRAEDAAGLPLVDEAERERLRRLADGDAPRAQGWRSALAWRGEQPVGYGGLVMGAGSPATGDVAVDRGRLPDPGPALEALLTALGALADREGAPAVVAWLRGAGERDLAAAAAAGYGVERRLGVLGRPLAGPVPDAPAPDARVRPYRPGVDDEAVVAVLAAAYAGTADAGWDLDELRARRELPWFRAEDLLLAEVDPEDVDASDVPRVAGIHWLKRRDADVGEVYNLAVHPEAQGRGLGPLLLAAGLAHLREVGCAEVLLWVDLANEPAVALYRGAGFATRWEDLALSRPPPAGA